MKFNVHYDDVIRWPDGIFRRRFFHLVRRKYWSHHDCLLQRYKVLICQKPRENTDLVLAFVFNFKVGTKML